MWWKAVFAPALKTVGIVFVASGALGVVSFLVSAALDDGE